MKKKLGTLMVLSVACMGLFSACTSNADAVPNPAPTANTAGKVTTAPMATTSPDATMDVMPMPTASAEPATVGAANTVDDAKRISQRVEDEVDKLSEVDDAEAVVIGNIALVGVSYDGQYQGGMTDRLKKMITERVEMTDKTITAVHVTDDSALYKSIAELNDMMDDVNASFETLQTRALDIAAKLTGNGIAQPQTGTGANQQSAT
ncbi:MAG: YhcN/YlaJ family sporulation lipoprotein [Clostridia bacterium]|nr:YhcN/YlaJ family sporulation lipoprotein [Clostridia bacterium]